MRSSHAPVWRQKSQKETKNNSSNKLDRKTSRNIAVQPRKSEVRSSQSSKPATDCPKKNWWLFGSAVGSSQLPIASLQSPVYSLQLAACSSLLFWFSLQPDCIVSAPPSRWSVAGILLDHSKRLGSPRLALRVVRFWPNLYSCCCCCCCACCIVGQVFVARFLHMLLKRLNLI